MVCLAVVSAEFTDWLRDSCSLPHTARDLRLSSKASDFYKI